MVGICAENLKTSQNSYSHLDAIFLHPAGKVLYHAGASTAVTHTWANGDRMIVKVDLIKNTVEWESTYPIVKQVIKCAIPVGMIGKNLYPVLYLLETHKDRVRFL